MRGAFYPTLGLRSNPVAADGTIDAMKTLTSRLSIVALAGLLLFSFSAVDASAATHHKKASHHSSQGKKKAHKPTHKRKKTQQH